MAGGVLADSGDGYVVMALAAMGVGLAVAVGVLGKPWLARVLLGVMAFGSI